MHARTTSWWIFIRESLWFVPALCTLLAAVLALMLVWIDHSFRFDQRQGLSWWLFGGGPEGARAVLAAIATTTVTVTGVIFSITIVALQLASSQFSPLVLRRFRADRGNQLVFGVFIGTFTYSLLVIRSVLSSTQDHEGFTPVLATTGGIGLALVCVAMLIFFIHHAARSVQASTIIDRSFNDSLQLIRQLYPEDIGEPEDSAPISSLPITEAAVVRATEAGYFQAVDEETLFGLSEQQTLIVQVERLPGEYVLTGSVLASVWPRPSVDESLEEQLRDAFVLGPERTLQSDVELGLRQLADVALKALSPGINDPTTAIQCIDHLSESLAQLGRRRRPYPLRTGESGEVRVLVSGPSYARLVEVAFAQIRQYGARDATVSAYLATSLGNIASLVPKERRAPLECQATLVVEGALAELSVREDRERVSKAAAWVSPNATAIGTANAAAD